MQKSHVAEATQDTPRLFTVDQFCGRQPALSQGQVRWLLFKSQDNGLAESGAIVRVGRRVLLDESKFFSWLLANQPRAESRAQPKRAT